MATTTAVSAANLSYYERHSESFDHIPFGPTLLPELLRTYLLPTSTDHHRLTALDVGSGPGALAAWMRDELQYEVECVDPSPAMAQRCSAKGLVTHCCGIQDYVPAQDDQVFNVIMCVSCLFHIPKPELAEEVVPKLDRLLRPGGLLVVSLMLRRGGEEGPDGTDVGVVPEAQDEGFIDPTHSGVRYFSGLQPAELLGLLGPTYSILHQQQTPVPAMGHDFWIAIVGKQ